MYPLVTPDTLYFKSRTFLYCKQWCIHLYFSRGWGSTFLLFFSHGPLFAKFADSRKLLPGCACYHFLLLCDKCRPLTHMNTLTAFCYSTHTCWDLSRYALNLTLCVPYKASKMSTLFHFCKRKRGLLNVSCAYFLIWSHSILSFVLGVVVDAIMVLQ